MEPNGLILSIMMIIVSDGALLLFGIIFNSKVAEWQEQDGGIYTATYVVYGVLATLIGATPQMLVVNQPGIVNMAIVLLSFCCSGLPMYKGSQDRHRKEAAEAKRRAASNAEDTLK